MEATWYQSNGHIYHRPEVVEATVQDIIDSVAKLKIKPEIEVREDGLIYVTPAEGQSIEVAMALGNANLCSAQSIYFSGIQINGKALDVSQEQIDFNNADMRAKGIM